MSFRDSWQQIAGNGSLSQQVKNRQKYVQDLRPQATTNDLFNHDLSIDQVTKKNCENLVGSVEIPVGLAGPVRFDFADQQLEALVPLATTEGALVASVNRGLKVIDLAQNATVLVEKRGMTRSPVFESTSGIEAQRFKQWFEDHMDQVKEIAEATSSHLHLMSYHIWIRGRYVYIRFAFDTEEAMGMNMVTIALQEALQEALNRNPQIKLVSLSSNVCTDKKDSVLNSILGRGYWVQPEVVVSKKLLKEVFHTTADRVFEVHHKKNLVGSNLAGSFSQNANVANILSAMYIATGQDPAHVVEGSKAFLQLESHDGDLYAALTMPNINLGVIGGGTSISQQKQARSIILSKPDIKAQELAAVVGIASLAGELSLIAALAQHQLAYAHAKLGRSNKRGE